MPPTGTILPLSAAAAGTILPLLQGAFDPRGGTEVGPGTILPRPSAAGTILPCGTSTSLVKVCNFETLRANLFWTIIFIRNKIFSKWFLTWYDKVSHTGIRSIDKYNFLEYSSSPPLSSSSSPQKSGLLTAIQPPKVGILCQPPNLWQAWPFSLNSFSFLTRKTLQAVKTFIQLFHQDQVGIFEEKNFVRCSEVADINSVPLDRQLLGVQHPYYRKKGRLWSALQVFSFTFKKCPKKVKKRKM